MDVLLLSHKLAGELAPTLQQAFPEASIQAFNGQLVIRAPDNATFERIAQLAARLDTPNRQLTVTVAQRDNGGGSRSNVDVGGGVIISNRGIGGGVAIYGGGNDRSYRSNTTQSVSTMDGGRAMISLGQSRFYPTLNFIYRPGYAIVTRGGAWQAAETGFWVEPHVQGDIVQLRLYPQSNRFTGDGSITSRGVYSEVSGRVGEWLPVGSSNDDGSSSVNGVLSGSRRSSYGSYTVWVRVEAR
ncbi:hypothetical protein [Andreprevotia sp. IGB-42]|uniref:hypothetical protein n=1 Tax=Andreprevotia sp. IGB-42 TaxID=2497473 RepID=UPI00135C39DD|nr:hypothetical protein [Andreprevotia sp. IGB-42]